MTQALFWKAFARLLDAIGQSWLNALAGLVFAMPLVLHLYASSQPTVKLTVEATGATGAAGVVKVSVWRDDKNFLKGEPYRILSAEMKDGKAVATFVDLEPGEYAVSAYQDKNNNGRLDTGFGGKPTEPYGFSNDARGRFGPPKFDQARFRLDASSTITVHLN
ncbi:MAG TPA: DUF2141 domain-containing protein [Bryobacteraceae bacterium]|jgi:uncharacterized protein (DUF2141 family)